MLKDKLFFYFFEGPPQPTGFGCFRALATTFDGEKWSEPEEAVRKGEIVWEVKVRDGLAYKTSYIGEHYNVAQSVIGIREPEKGAVPRMLGHEPRKSLMVWGCNGLELLGSLAGKAWGEALRFY